MSQILVFDKAAAKEAGWPERMIQHAEALVARVIARGDHGAKNADATAKREAAAEQRAAARSEAAADKKDRTTRARGRTARGRRRK